MLARDGELRVPSAPNAPLLVGKLVAKADSGKWQEAQLLLPSTESFVSKKRRFPSSQRARLNSLSSGWFISGKWLGVSSQGNSASGCLVPQEETITANRSVRNPTDLAVTYLRIKSLDCLLETPSTTTVYAPASISDTSRVALTKTSDNATLPFTSMTLIISPC